MPKGKKEKVRYEVDPHNRLVIKETGKRAELSRFRQVLTGHFKINKDNSLSYLIRAPLPKELGIPHQVKFRGNWSLTKDHNLRLTLNKWERQTLGDKLTLQGRVISVTKDSLLFSVTTRTKKDVESMYVLKLQGIWQADKNNQLTFRVKRKRGRRDILTFKGAWEINKHHRIIYRYKKAELIEKRKKVHTLTFKGYWDVKDKTRISYVLSREINSAFTFRISGGIFKRNYIKYELGIEVSGELEPVTRTVTLFGTWKIKKGIGLLFEVEYEKDQVHAVVFGAKARLTAKDRISFKLRDQRNKTIGAELELSHKILKGDGESFLRFLKSKRESSVIIGAGFRW